MGLIIICSVCLAVLIIVNVWKKKKEENSKRRFYSISQCIVAIVLLMSVLALILAFTEALYCEYLNEELVEVIELNEIESNVYINYNYILREYSYMSNESSDGKTIKPLCTDINRIEEIISENEGPIMNQKLNLII